MRKMKAVSAVVLGLCLGTSALSAQITGTINATATVLSSITVASGANLVFGNVTPGVNKTVAATGAGAGRYDVNAATSTPVSLTFTLPGTLVSGGNNLTINTWTGYWNTTNSQSGGTAFTPSAAATTATTAASGTTTLYVFVGATVAPTGGQAAGNYSAAVTMGVVYN
jgi:hypothetical protein